MATMTDTYTQTDLLQLQRQAERMRAEAVRDGVLGAIAALRRLASRLTTRRTVGTQSA